MLDVDRKSSGSQNTSAANQSLFVQNQINDLNMKHSGPSDEQSQALTVPAPKLPPKKTILTQQNIVCETEYAAPSFAAESMKQSVIANTVIQFEFNVKHDQVRKENEVESAAQRRQASKALKAKRRAENGADDFVEPEPLDLE